MGKHDDATFRKQEDQARALAEETTDEQARLALLVAAECARFRRVAGLHGNSENPAVIGVAEGSGKDRPGADRVRAAVERYRSACAGDRLH